MLIFRYLVKDVYLTFFSLVIILVLIFISDTFFSALHRAANGEVPFSFIMNLMIIELPNLLWKVLPLGFYISLLIVYSRLYAESEMTALQACGYGPVQLLKHSFIMASPIAITVAVIMLWFGPIIIIKEAQLLKTSSIQFLIKTIIPGRFREQEDALQVFYVESMNIAHTDARHVFMAKFESNEGQPKWDVLWADRVSAKLDKKISSDHVIITKGIVYEGMPGYSNYKVTEFNRVNVRLPSPNNPRIKDDIRAIKTLNLLPLKNADGRKVAELNWRLSIPLMVFTLTLIVVPLCRVNSRASRFSKLLPAILIYIFYLHLLCYIHRAMMCEGAFFGGVWCLHITIVGLSLVLYFSNSD